VTHIPALDKAGAERVVAEIVWSGSRAVAFQSDMADEADFGNAVSCARLNFGNPDFVFNNTRAIIRKMSPRQGRKKTIFQSSLDTSPRRPAQIPHKGGCATRSIAHSQAASGKADSGS
jgi:hypothetical protein